jgi:thiamine pyrophosphokinase
VGDLDSVTPETLAHFTSVSLVRDADQDRTDTEKAIDHALSRGPFDEITLLGASSGRLDHVVGHIGLLRKYLGRVRLVMEDASERAYAAQSDVKLESPRGAVISFFAVGAPARHVTTENLRFPLVDRTLELGVQDSISNVVDAAPAWIRYQGGPLFVIETKNP